MDTKEKVKAYYDQAHHFKEDIAILRKIARKTRAQEDFKWHAPVYTFQGKNLFWIARFKNHYSLGFFNGSLLKDAENVLVNAQEGKTVSMRHWKFKAQDTIDEEKVLSYMEEAILNQEMSSE